MAILARINHYSSVCMPLAQPLLCRPEQVLFARLVRAFPGNVILAHVALSRLLPGSGSATAGGTADFVVCRADFTALAIFELATAGRSETRDACALLRAAGIKVISVPPADIPIEADLRTLLATLPLHPQAPPLRRAS